MGWWLGLEPAGVFGFDSKREEPGETGRHPVFKCRVPHGSQPRSGWAPDPPMVGIRSPDGLVVGSCTSHPGVLGSIPKREEPGKTGRYPVLKYLVPHGSHTIPLPPREQLYNRSRCCIINTHARVWATIGPRVARGGVCVRGAARPNCHMLTMPN